MTRRRQGRLAIAVLGYLLPDDDYLIGDLLEGSRVHSGVWLWRQVTGAVLIRRIVPLRDHKRLTAETLLVGAAMLVVLAFQAVVAASLLNRARAMWDPFSVIGSNGEYQRWHVSAIVTAFLAAVGIGWMSGRLHRRHRLAAVLAFGAGVIAPAFLDFYLFVPQTDLHVPFTSQLSARVGEAIVLLTGLFIGLASHTLRPGSVPSSLSCDPTGNRYFFLDKSV